MTQQMDDLMKMAREAGAIPIREKPKDVALVGIDAIERFAQLVAKKAVESERHRIQDEFSMSVQSDLEHGVKSLNEKAAKDFQADYPELNKFWGWLNARD